MIGISAREPSDRTSWTAFIAVVWPEGHSRPTTAHSLSPSVVPAGIVGAAAGSGDIGSTRLETLLASCS